MIMIAVLIALGALIALSALVSRPEKDLRVCCADFRTFLEYPSMNGRNGYPF